MVLPRRDSAFGFQGAVVVGWDKLHLDAHVLDVGFEKGTGLVVEAYKVVVHLTILKEPVPCRKGVSDVSISRLPTFASSVHRLYMNVARVSAYEDKHVGRTLERACGEDACEVNVNLVSVEPTNDDL